MQSDLPAPINGYVDDVSHEDIRGWAFDPAQPDVAVTLVVSADDAVLARVVANSFRADLAAAGIGDGRHAFRIECGKLGLPLGPVTISVQVEGSGVHLPRSPWRLEAPLLLTEAVRQRVAALFETPGEAGELCERAAFLAGQAEQLLQRVAERQSRRGERAAALARKWRWRAEDGPAPGPAVPRALVVDSTAPAAGRDAGSNAVTSHMLSLQRLGFEVTFVAADLTAAPELLALGVAAVGVPWAASVEEVLRRQSGAWDLVYLHRLDVARAYLPLVRLHAPRARVVFSVADLASLRLLRQAEVEDRPELRPHAQGVRAAERAAAAASDAVVTHSGLEAGLLRQWVPGVACAVVPWVFPVAPTPAGFEGRSGVLFVGHFGHPPNRDAAIWLMDEIMPLVWASDPEIGCTVVGTGVPAEVLRRGGERVRVLGAVADLRGELDRVRMTVAPLAFGAGLKGKVGESLAAGVPCVCTSIAAEGYALPAPLAGLVADDAAGLAASIVRLHGDGALFAACREAGLAYVEAGFSEAAVDAAMRGVAGVRGIGEGA